MANPLYIQILKNVPFTPMVGVEESTDGDMVILAHYAPKDPSKYTEPEKEKEHMNWKMIQRKSLRASQCHVIDGSSALIVNESQTSNDVPRFQTPSVSTSEQINNDSQEQVLELEEDQFYTLINLMS
ncbi:hypothetical protein AgCh_028511 [Apium graveolens]